MVRFEDISWVVIELNRNTTYLQSIHCSFEAAIKKTKQQDNFKAIPIKSLASVKELVYSGKAHGNFIRWFESL